MKRQIGFAEAESAGKKRVTRRQRFLAESQFARDFIRSDYNFCAAKIAVARGGKVKEGPLKDLVIAQGQRTDDRERGE